MRNQTVLTEITPSELQLLFRQEIESLLSHFSKQQPQQEQAPEQPEQLLTTEEAASLLRLTVRTIYDLHRRGEIPSCKRSKRLYFSRSELIDWVRQSRKRTSVEIEKEAEDYLKKEGGSK